MECTTKSRSATYGGTIRTKPPLAYRFVPHPTGEMMRASGVELVQRRCLERRVEAKHTRYPLLCPRFPMPPLGFIHSYVPRVILSSLPTLLSLGHLYLLYVVLSASFRTGRSRFSRSLLLVFFPFRSFQLSFFTHVLSDEPPRSRSPPRYFAVFCESLRASK